MLRFSTLNFIAVIFCNTDILAYAWFTKQTRIPSFVGTGVCVTCGFKYVFEKGIVRNVKRFCKSPHTNYDLQNRFTYVVVR